MQEKGLANLGIEDGHHNRKVFLITSETSNTELPKYLRAEMKAPGSFLKVTIYDLPQSCASLIKVLMFSDKNCTVKVDAPICWASGQVLERVRFPSEGSSIFYQTSPLNLGETVFAKSGSSFLVEYGPILPDESLKAAVNKSLSSGIYDTSKVSGVLLPHRKGIKKVTLSPELLILEEGKDFSINIQTKSIIAIENSSSEPKALKFKSMKESRVCLTKMPE